MTKEATQRKSAKRWGRERKLDKKSRKGKDLLLDFFFSFPPSCSQESRNERKLEEGEPVEQRTQNTNKHQPHKHKTANTSLPHSVKSIQTHLFRCPFHGLASVIPSFIFGICRFSQNQISKIKNEEEEKKKKKKKKIEKIRNESFHFFPLFFSF